MSVVVEVLTAPPFAIPMPTGTGSFHGASITVTDINTVNATLLVVAIANDATNIAPRQVGSVTSTGLTFTRVALSVSGFNGSNANALTDVWTAPLSGPLSSASITLNATGPGMDSASVIIFGLIGATGLDAGAGTLPATASDITSPVNQVTVDTTNANTLLLYLGGSIGGSDQGVPAGWTEVFYQNGFSGVFPSSLTAGLLDPGAVQTGLVVMGPGSSNSNSMLVFGVLPGTGTVPNVVGLTDAAAHIAIFAANLTVGTITIITGGTPGEVASQLPIAGATVAIGSAVNLVEYQGATVPNVVNTSATAVAPGIITGAGFVVGSITFITNVLIIPGNVVSQSPAAGSSAAAGSAINLVVSEGRAGLGVPDIIGLTEAEAIAAIVAVGLLVNVITIAPSATMPSGLVSAQNPSGGTFVASGSYVGFIVSSGPAVPGELFDFEATVISQYANSPTILQLIDSMNQYIDQTTNFANFYNFLWNVDTAVGFGLDVWGVIVNVSRLLQIPTTARYVGFQNTSGPAWDEEPFSAKGSFFTGHNATQSYLLDDDSYRRLILTKALANIVNTTAPALNQLLQKLFPGRGNPFVANDGGMHITYTFDFALTPVELAILQQSGAVPSPVGVTVAISVP